METTKPSLCRLGLHRYRHVTQECPPGSIPEFGGIPTNPFTVARTVYVCIRCGQLHPRLNPASAR